ncbi:head decoration protein, partial [Salmonella enterica subsp. enterica serovar Veneziana]|nr:head decoration protein [Salmonella enterica subsp. enterica serovar Veneziana]
MSFKTVTQQRDEHRIFAGNDPAYTTTGASGITTATPAL